MDTVDSVTGRRLAQIRQWMAKTVSNGGIERLDDLHVDRIDEDWHERSTWITAGLTAYQLAVQVQNELGFDITVALAFSLIDGNRDSDAMFNSQSEFERQLDWSPPSLYLFKRGDRRHLSEPAELNPLPDTVISGMPAGTQAFLLKWAGENGEQRRSIFVQA